MAIRRGNSDFQLYNIGQIAKQFGRIRKLLLTTKMSNISSTGGKEGKVEDNNVDANKQVFKVEGRVLSSVEDMD